MPILRARLATLAASLLLLTVTPLTGCVAVWHEPTAGVDLARFGLDTPTRQQLLNHNHAGHTPISTTPRSSHHTPTHLPLRLAVAEIGVESLPARYRLRPTYAKTYTPPPPIILVRERDLATPPTPRQLERLSALPTIAHAFPLDPRAQTQPFSKPRNLFDLARAQHADLLLIYTFTSRADHEDQAPLLSAATLGLLPTWVAKSRAVVEIAVFDLRDQLPVAFDQREADAHRVGNFYTTDNQLDDADLAARSKALALALDAFQLNPSRLNPLQ